MVTDHINVLLYSHWRAGTNAFCSIFVEKLNYYYLDDYFSQLSFDKIVGEISLDENVRVLLKNRHNDVHKDYLKKILDKLGIYNTILKVMPTDLYIIDEELLRYFPVRIFLYRKNIFDLLISFAVAKTTNAFWYKKELEPFKGKIDEELFKKLCSNVLYNYELLINSDPNVDFTFEYEQDLLPYIKENPITFKKHLPYTLHNLNNLNEIYLEIFNYKQKDIDEYVLKKRQENKMELGTLIQSLSDEILFWRQNYVIK